MKLTIKLLLILFLISEAVLSQVKINEYSCSNISTITDAYGEYEDWVELYNSGGSSVNLAGYYLSDKSSNLTKWQIPSGTINANGFMVIHCSGRNTVNGSQLHPNFTLSQSENDWIILTQPNGTTVADSFKIIHKTMSNHSVGRTTNGAATFSLFTVPTPGNSNSGAVNFYTPKPVMNLAPGFYASAQTVTITCSMPSATIRYTLDGSDVTNTSPIYSAPISVGTTKVIRAKAFSTNLPSFTETNTYFINVSHTVPVVSVCSADVFDLIANGNGWGVNKVGAFELFEDDGSFKDEGEGDFNKHGNDSWAYDQRGFDFIMRDEFGYNNEVHHKIFPEKSRDKFQRLIIKAAANDNYPFENGGAYIRDAYTHTLSIRAGLKLDERTWRPCVLYLNGQYWGVYEIREKINDHDYTKYYDNQDKYHLEYLMTWGSTWEEYGTPNALNNWNNLVSYIQSNNMGVQSNFDYVDSQLNWESLVDYFVFNSVTVTQDWLNWNTSWWRGTDPLGDKKRWRYTLWDMDATFGHYINYTGIPDNSADADPCNVEALPDPGGQGHTEILQKLINENPVVEQYYKSRYIDLLNTYLKCDYMIPLLDSMINEIQPEMQRQINRWGGTMAEWQANVQALRDFINARCPALQSGLVDCYTLTGPFNVTFDVSPANAGIIQVNSQDILNYPWSGQYYGGIQVLCKAKPNTGFVFDHWEYVDPMTLGPNEDTNSLLITQAQTIKAIFISDIGDSDGDGLTDDEETTGVDDPITPLSPSGTSDPANPCDPFTTGPACDPDNDGLTNQQETTNGTNPNDPDSDDDGLTDGEEVKNIDNSSTVLVPTATSDPNNPCDPNITSPNCDSDGDGLTYQEETNLNSDPNDPCDPNSTGGSCDPDNDGLSNDEEEVIHTNPNNPDSDGDGLTDGEEASNIDDSSTVLVPNAITDPNDYCDPINTTPACIETHGVNFPTGFSPNQDGKNELLILHVGTDVHSFTLSIFDRWGNKLVSTNDPKFEWDGIYLGKPLSSGVYAYVLEVVYENGSSEQTTGNITLIR